MLLYVVAEVYMVKTYLSHLLRLCRRRVVFSVVLFKACTVHVRFLDSVVIVVRREVQ